MSGTIEESSGPAVAGASHRQTPALGDVRFPGIEGLRGIAAIAVVVNHTVAISTLIATQWGAYLAQLRAGVQIFFVISGFVLYRPFVAAHLANRKGPRLAGYFRRRFFRIFPAYWAVLIVAVYGLHVLYLVGVKATVIHFSLLQTYFPISSFLNGLAPAWTLVVEVTFYVALPLISFVIWRLGTGRRRLAAELVGVGSLLAVGIFSSAWTAFGSPPSFIDILPANLPAFSLGMLLAVGSSWGELHKVAAAWLNRVAARAWIWWAGAAFAFSAMVWAVHYPSVLPIGQLLGGQKPIPGTDAFADSLLCAIVGVTLVVPVVFSGQPSLIRRSLRTRPMLFAGMISYGIYLWHVPMIQEIESVVYHHGILSPTPHYNFAAITILTLAATIVVATISWYVIERPLISFSRAPWRVHALPRLAPYSALIRDRRARPRGREAGDVASNSTLEGDSQSQRSDRVRDSSRAAP